MKMRLSIAVMVLLIAAVADAAMHRTRNFSISTNTMDQEFAKRCADVCEQSREKLAVEWIGRRLPNWSRPCPVRVDVNRRGNGGATTFAFDNGRAFGWRMRVHGTQRQILDSCLPHEVSHTVFATAIGRPLPHWCDEGAAMLAENPAARQAFLNRAFHMVRTSRYIPLRHLFAMTQYPRSGSGVLDLYSQGMMLTHYLVAQKGKRDFFKFVQAGANESALRQVYRVSLRQLQSDWVVATERSRRGEVLVAQNNSTQNGTSNQNTKPTLYVYGASWCDPCKKAKSDKLSGRWDEIEDKFSVVFRDVERHRNTVSRIGITDIPAFVVNDRIVVNTYQSPQLLTQSLFQNCPLFGNRRPPARRQPRQRQPRQTSPSLGELQRAIIGFMRANPEMFKGPKGDKGDPGNSVNPQQVEQLQKQIQDWMTDNAELFKGPKGDIGNISGDQVADAVANAVSKWFAEHPLDESIKDQIKAYLDADADKIREQIAAALKQYFDEHPLPDLPDFSVFVTKNELQSTLENLSLPTQPTSPLEHEQHLVIVADKTADYWPQLENEIKNAQNKPLGIRVAPPPASFSVEHPQLIFYRDGNWEKQITGHRAVSEVLDRIAQGEFK